jgi:hypothetical protein
MRSTRQGGDAGADLGQRVEGVHELAQDAQHAPGILVREGAALAHPRHRPRCPGPLQQQFVLGVFAGAGGAAEGQVGDVALRVAVAVRRGRGRFRTAGRTLLGHAGTP